MGHLDALTSLNTHTDLCGEIINSEDREKVLEEINKRLNVTEQSVEKEKYHE